MDWKECCDRRIAKDVSVDKEMVKSLMKSSEKKLESEKRLELYLVT